MRREGWKYEMLVALKDGSRVRRLGSAPAKVRGAFSSIEEFVQGHAENCVANGESLIRMTVREWNFSHEPKRKR